MANRPEDLNLPSAVVTRIIKDTLPPQAKISKEAQAAIAKAASVFVLYATSCSTNVAAKANRKTIQGIDVVDAMTEMDFEKFVKPLENSLRHWKESQVKKKETAAKKRKDAEKNEKEAESDSPKKRKAEESDDEAMEVAGDPHHSETKKEDDDGDRSE